MLLLRLQKCAGKSIALLWQDRQADEGSLTQLATRVKLVAAKVAPRPRPIVQAEDSCSSSISAIGKKSPAHASVGQVSSQPTGPQEDVVMSDVHGRECDELKRFVGGELN